MATLGDATRNNPICVAPPKVAKAISRAFSHTNLANVNHPLSGVYTGEKTLHVVTVASEGNLKRWEDKDFY